MNKHKGFTLVEGLLILIVVGLLAGAGVYVWKHHSKTTPAATTTSSTKTSTPKSAAAVDPTADWTAYSSKQGQFSVKYPSSWVTGRNQQNCEDFLMLGHNSTTTGTCQSESSGEMFVVSIDEDKQAVYELSNANYSGLKKENITINNVAGQKESGVFKGPLAESGFGPDVGTNTVVYIFFTNNRTYVAEYQTTANNPDVLSDFNLMVTKTLKFSS